MDLMKHHIWIFLFVILLVPLVINVVCVTVVPYPVVGDGTHWLGFFGSYIGGVMTVLMTMYVIRSEKKKENARKRYENQKEYYEKLCSDMGTLCGVLDLDRFSFLIQRLHETKSLEAVNQYVKDLEMIDREVKSSFNTFALRYGNIKFREQKVFLEYCSEVSEKMRDMITKIQDSLVDLQLKKKNDFFCLQRKDVFQKLGELSISIQPIQYAREWKKVEYEKLMNYEKEYVNC